MFDKVISVVTHVNNQIFLFALWWPFHFAGARTQLGELSQSNQRLELSSTRLDETQRRLDSRMGVISESAFIYFHYFISFHLLAAFICVSGTLKRNRSLGGRWQRHFASAHVIRTKEATPPSRVAHYSDASAANGSLMFWNLLQVNLIILRFEYSNDWIFV